MRDDAMNEAVREANDPALTSWLDCANAPDTPFPIQNLPMGVFVRREQDQNPEQQHSGVPGLPGIGVAIGDCVLGVRAMVELGLLDDLDPTTRCALSAPTLNDFMGLDRWEWTATRCAISRLMRSDCATLRDDADARAKVIMGVEDVAMRLPATIGDYTDFYASIHHATNVGRMFRPDNPLLPNYKHLPVGYHGRASSIVVSGTEIRRPMGQTMADGAEAPTFGPCRLLDYELEVGCFLGGSNPIGARIDIDDAPNHLFGLCLVNDWSARDVQKWEYVPLGPFNAKNFATTISPWIVLADALAPFIVAPPARAAEDPEVLEYLKPTEDLAFDITVEAFVSSQTMREQGTAPHQLSAGNFRGMYWSFAQMLAHHTSTGCPIRPGDLIASGTVSGPEESARGCLLELTWRGQNPISLPDGTERRFLQDGDELTLHAFCDTLGAKRIGFGDCAGVILPAE
jgi:fumarylacetoacetase